jgi:hypothetical protein
MKVHLILGGAQNVQLVACVGMHQHQLRADESVTL